MLASNSQRQKIGGGGGDVSISQSGGKNKNKGKRKSLSAVFRHRLGRNPPQQNHTQPAEMATEVQKRAGAAAEGAVQGLSFGGLPAP